MNSNIKFFGAFVLLILVMFGYEKYKAQQREDAFFDEFKTNSASQQNPPSQVYDPNAIINYPFGFSIPKLADLKMLPMASENSYTFIDAQSSSRNDLIMVIPTTDDLNTVVQNLQTAGTPFTRIENGLSTSFNENGMAMNMVYNPSPNGGGLSIIRVVTGAPAISQQSINALFNGIRFREATASLTEQQQLMEMDIQNQRIANQRQTSSGNATMGDVFMERAKSLIYCYGCN